MPIKVNGTTIAKLIVDGTERKCVKVGSTCVFMKRTQVYVNLQYTKNISVDKYTECNTPYEDYYYTLKNLKLYCYIADTDVIKSVSITIGFNITGKDGTVLCTVPSQTLTFTASGTKSLSYTSKATHDAGYNPGLYFKGLSVSPEITDLIGTWYITTSTASISDDTDVATTDSDVLVSRTVYTTTISR